jgi:DUF1980 C-terminal domain
LTVGHAHAHAETDGEGTYFLDQLFTILLCGAIGVVAISMYATGMLGRILVPMFFVPTLLGGAAILVLAVIRAIAVWQLAGARKAALAEASADGANHDHSHSHGHDHGHAHSHSDADDHGHEHGADCGHDHAHSHAGGDDHGHDHGWAPWRYMVLAIPVFLYMMDLPRGGFSDQWMMRQQATQLQQSPKRQALSLLAGGPALTRVMKKAEAEQRLLQLRFKELVEAAAIPMQHEVYEGDIGVLRGQFLPVRASEREFTLYRENITCCRADMVMLETRIVAPDPVREIQYGQWVQVRGVISFEKNEKGKWIPVITLKGNEDIDPHTEPATDYQAY